MAQLPILPLKVDAMLGDTNHLTAEEFGAYARILFTMWRHEAQIRDDPDELARIAGVSRKRWDAIGERVMRPTTRAGGIVSQKRLTATWMEVQALRQRRAAGGKIRWGKQHELSSSSPDARLMLGTCNPKPNKNGLPGGESERAGEAAADGGKVPVSAELATIIAIGKGRRP